MTPSMETMISSSSLSIPQEVSTYDGISMQQSLLFSDTLKATMRCLSVVSSVVQICGESTHIKRGTNTAPLQVHFHIFIRGLHGGGFMYVQAAALNMIADISRNKRSASAFEVVLKKVSGLVVGIACSSIAGLHDASINALSGLACVDPDLIWLLLADVYYSLKKGIPSLPSADFAEVTQLLPPSSSSKDYLYVQYGGESFGFDVDLSSAEVVFRKLQSKSVF